MNHEIHVAADGEAIPAGHTILQVTVRAHGEMREGWAEAVDGVWNHFLNEQLKPWVEAGKHLETGDCLPTGPKVDQAYDTAVWRSPNDCQLAEILVQGN